MCRFRGSAHPNDRWEVGGSTQKGQAPLFQQPPARSFSAVLISPISAGANNQAGGKLDTDDAITAN